MKTLGFYEIDTVVREDGSAVLRIKGNAGRAKNYELSADELMMLMVEMGNALADCRKVEDKKRKAKELRREQRRKRDA